LIYCCPEMPSHKSLIEAIQFKKLLSVWVFASSHFMTGRSNFINPLKNASRKWLTVLRSGG
jgi:hypothetical protein